MLLKLNPAKDNGNIVSPEKQISFAKCKKRSLSKLYLMGESFMEPWIHIINSMPAMKVVVLLKK